MTGFLINVNCNVVLQGTVSCLALLITGLLAYCFYNSTSYVQNVQSWNEQIKTERQSSVPVITYNLTTVTAFYDIGSFPKGGQHNIRTKNQYYDWARAYKFFASPLIVYSDTDEFLDLMRQLRKGKETITKIIKLPRTELWPFKIKAKVEAIFAQPKYPKHYPNTVIADYSLLQHSKFALVKHSIEQEYFKSRHYCWLDIGVYRDIAKSNRTFYVEPPPLLDTNKVGYCRLYNVDPQKETAKSIFYHNKVWVTGNAFVGTEKTIMKFCDQYKRTIEYYNSKNLANTDQQTLLAMFTNESLSNIPIDVSLQVYNPGAIKGVSCPDNWFYLAYVMRKLT